MADNAKPNGSAKAEPGSTDQAIQGLSMLFGDTVKQLVANAEAQQVAILALTSILVVVPGIAQIDKLRLATIVQTLTQGRKDADHIRERIAAYVAMIVSMADKVPEALAEAEAKLGPQGSAKAN